MTEASMHFVILGATAASPRRVVKLEERYVSVRTLFENRLLIVLNNRSFTQQESYTTTKRIVVSESRLVETNEHFRFLQECINWCKDKLVSKEVVICVY